MTGRDRRVVLPGGTEVRLREWGREGSPLLLVHGFMGGAAEWGDLPQELPGVHAVALDLPGHGESGGDAQPGRYTIPRVARELGALAQAVFGEPAWWLGYSMGGRIALAAAAEGIPMRGLLLEGASPGLREEGGRRVRREEDEARARTLEAQGMAAFVDRWLELPLFAGLHRLPREVRRAARDLRAGQDPERMAAWLRGGGTGIQPSYWDALPGMEIPVHLLVGEEDGKFSAVAEEMAADLPRCTVTRVPGAGHLPHLETPAAWVAWVRGVLEG